MADETEITDLIGLEIERLAAQRATLRAKAAKWDLDVGVFFFAVLCTVIILLFQGIPIEIIAPAAIVGLALGWLMGWRKGKQAYQIFYDEELSKLGKDLTEKEEKIAETIEEKIQKVLRERQQ